MRGSPPSRLVSRTVLSRSAISFLRPCQSPPCGSARRAFQKQQLKSVQGAQTSSAKLGQTPSGAPEYANHNTYVAITVNRGDRCLARYASPRDVPLQLLDVLGLFLDDVFDQVADGQHAHHPAALHHRQVPESPIG